MGIGNTGGPGFIESTLDFETLPDRAPVGRGIDAPREPGVVASSTEELFDGIGRDFDDRDAELGDIDYARGDTRVAEQGRELDELSADIDFESLPDQAGQRRSDITQTTEDDTERRREFAWRQAEEPSSIRVLLDKLTKPFVRSQAEEQARAMNIMAVASELDLPPHFVDQNYEVINKELGLNQQPTLEDIAGFGMTMAVVAGLMAHPLATVLGVAGFTALGEVESAVISAIQNEEYTFGEMKDLREFLPENATEDVQALTFMFDFMAKAGVLGFVGGGSRYMRDMFTKDMIKEYKMPEKIYIPADKLEQLSKGEKIGDVLDSRTEAVWRALKLEPEQFKFAAENGLDLEIPSYQLVTIVDKPYWESVKRLIRKEPTNMVLARFDDKAKIRGTTHIKEVDDTVVSEVNEANRETLWQNDRPLGEGADRFRTLAQRALEVRGYSSRDAQELALLNAELLDARARTWAVDFEKHPEDWWDVAFQEEMIGTVMPEGQNRLFQSMEDKYGPMWYSPLLQTINQKVKTSVVSIDKLKHDIDRWITKGNVRKDEVEWSSIYDLLDEMQAAGDSMVNKEQLLQTMQHYILSEPKMRVALSDEQTMRTMAEDQVIQQLEIAKDDGLIEEDVDFRNMTLDALMDMYVDVFKPKEEYNPSQYIREQFGFIPGHEGYRSPKIPDWAEKSKTGPDYIEYTNKPELSPGDYLEFYITLPKDPEYAGRDITKSHVEGADVMVRAERRKTVDGKDALVLVELQSDLHQQAQRTQYLPTKADYDAAIDELHTIYTESMKNRIDTATSPEIADGLKLSLDAYDKMGKFGDKADAVLRTYRDLFGLDYAIDKPYVLDYLTEVFGDRQLAERVYDLYSKVEDATGVPNAPYKESWPLMAWKQVLRFAAENDFEYVALPDAETHIGFWGTNAVIWSVEDSVLDVGHKVVVLNKSGYRPYSAVAALEEDPINVNPYEWNDGHASNALLTTDGVTRKVSSSNGEWGSIGEWLRDGNFMLPSDYSPSKFAEATDRIANRIIDKVKSGETSGYIAPRAEGLRNFYNKKVPGQVKRYMNRNNWGKTETIKFQEQDPRTLAGPDASPSELPIYKRTAYRLTEEVKNDILYGKGQPLFQTTPKGKPRGATTFDRLGKAYITLLRDSNASTLSHEALHVIIEEMVASAGLEGAPERLVNDVAALEKWLGIEDGKWLNTHREKVAAEAELYILDGKAPSKRLLGTFDRLRTWMLRVYRQFRNKELNINPELRRFMDHALATEDEIVEVHNLLNIRASMTKDAVNDEAWAVYSGLVQSASQKAAQEMRKRRDVEYKDNLIKWRKGSKDYADSHQITRTADEVKLRGISAESVADYDKQTVKRLKERGFIKKEGGEPVEALAEDLGFDRSEELVELLSDGYRTRDELRLEYINMQEAEYAPESRPDMQMGGITDEYIQLLEFELDTINAKLGKRPARPSRDLINAIDDRVSSLSVNRLTTEREALTAGLKKAAVDAENAFREATRLERKKAGQAIADVRQSMKDAHRAHVGRIYERARLAKEKQRVIALELRARERIKSEIDTAVRQIKAAVKSKSVNPEYRDRMRSILAQFDLVKRSKKTLDRRESFREWFDRQTEEDIEVFNIPDKFIEASYKKNYKEMSRDEVLELRDAIKSLEHNGRLKNKLLQRKEQRSLTTAVKISSDRIRESGIEQARARITADYPQVPSARKSRRPFQKFLDKVEAAHYELIKPEFMFHAMDNWADHGPVHTYLYLPAKKAEDLKFQIYESVIKDRLVPQFEAAKRDGALDWNEKTIIDGIPDPLTTEERIMVALNCGNDGNYRSLSNGYRWNDTQIQSILDSLNDAEVTLVRNIWDTVESMYEPMANVYRELTGTGPKRITPRMVRFGAVEVEGGYFPIVLDRELSYKADQYSLQKEANDLMNAYKGYHKPSPRKQFTIERKGTDLPPALSFNVLFKHVQDVAHFTSHAIPVRDMFKIAKHPDFVAAVKETWGDNAYQTIEPWIRDLARPRREPVGMIERGFSRLRRNTTSAILGLSFQVGFVQPLSFLHTAQDVGVVTSTRAIWSFMRHPKTMYKFVMDNSPFMRNRAVTWDRDVGELYDKLDPRGTKITSALKATYFTVLRAFDMAATLPTWMAGYMDAVNKYEGKWPDILMKGDKRTWHEFAADHADQLVRKSQPVGSMKDRSPIQRGTELMKTITMFYTFLNVYHNRLVWKGSRYHRLLKTGNMTPREYLGMLRDFSLMVLVPSMLLFYIRNHRWPSDWKEAGAATISYSVAGIPVVRDVVNSAVAGYDYGASPTFEAMRVSTQLLKGLDDPEWWEVKGIVDLLGYSTGIPSKQINRTMDGVRDIINGETSNPVHLLIPKKDNKGGKSKNRNKIHW
jgi:hypothetical protein